MPKAGVNTFVQLFFLITSSLHFLLLLDIQFFSDHSINVPTISTELSCSFHTGETILVSSAYLLLALFSACALLSKRPGTGYMLIGVSVFLFPRTICSMSVIRLFLKHNFCATTKYIPCGTKFLREFIFADWRFFVFCGN